MPRASGRAGPRETGSSSPASSRICTLPHPQRAQLSPLQMLPSAPLLDQPFPESGLGLGEPRALLPESPKLITMVDVALQKSGAATQPTRHAAAWLPVGLWSNKSPRLQGKGISQGRGQCGGCGPIVQIPWARRSPGEATGCGGVRWLRHCWTGPKSSRLMRVVEASTHCIGLFLVQPAEQEFGSPGQNLFASVSAHQGEDRQHATQVRQHPPCPLRDQLTLASALLWCVPHPSPPQRPVGTVPPPQGLEL